MRDDIPRCVESEDFLRICDEQAATGQEAYGLGRTVRQIADKIRQRSLSAYVVTQDARTLRSIVKRASVSGQVNPIRAVRINRHIEIIEHIAIRIEFAHIVVAAGRGDRADKSIAIWVKQDRFRAPIETVAKIA